MKRDGMGHDIMESDVVGCDVILYDVVSCDDGMEEGPITINIA